MKKFALMHAAAALILGVGCSSSSSETCGSGTINQNGTCVAVDAGAGLTCGAGTVALAGQCVAIDAGSGVVCGDGTVLVGGQCVAVDAGPGTVCGTGTELDGGVCQPVAPAIITVTSVGPGTGFIKAPHLICSGPVCTIAVPIGTEVEFTAAADPGYLFLGWSEGGCSGTGTCKVTATGYTAIKAGFTAATFWNNNGGVFAAPLDGGSSQQLFGVGEAPQPNGDYSISRDGMTLAFNTSGGIWVADYWAGLSRQVTQTRSWGAIGAVFSPDGQSLAFTNNGLYTVHTDGSSMATVTTNSVATDDCHNVDCATTRFVAWSPDGTRVAWMDSSAVMGDATNTPYRNVWIANADGTNAARLTDFNSMSNTSDPAISGLDWSPDGSKIAFISSQDPGMDRTGAAGITVANIWTVDVASKALFCVTTFDTEYYLDIPTYARTGNQVVFGATLEPAMLTGAIKARNLFTVADDGTGLRALTTSAHAYSAGPYWFADGKTLLFESSMDPADPTRTRRYGIWSMTLDANAVPAPISYDDNWDSYSPLDDND